MSASQKFGPEILQKLELLQNKYSEAGQDLAQHLEGLLHSDYPNYWEYIRLETLLSLQTPKTSIPDEKSFILFHQISELYFKLCLLELSQIAGSGQITLDNLTQRVLRVLGYLKTLTASFDSISEGMDPGQFVRFRTALAPASGFQSVQYRMIEISCTDLVNLVVREKRCDWSSWAPADIPRIYECLYWKYTTGAVEGSGKPLTLRQFEKKYSKQLLELAENRVTTNLWQCFLRVDPADGEKSGLREALRQLDAYANIHWPLAHYKSALKHIQPGSAPTGGSNWQKYLPSRFQKRMFYPELWSFEEQEEWGKEWVENNLVSGQGTERPTAETSRFPRT